MNRRFAVAATVVLLLLSVGSVSAEAAVPCASLTRLTLPDGTVTAAESVAAGSFVPPVTPGRTITAGARDALAKLPAFCRVAVTSKPSVDSDIKIEVWLPVVAWNGKLQAVSDGGLAGFIPYALMAPALAQGYVASGTDTGHVGGNADFMPGHPEKLVDFAYRSTHQMAVAAKAVIAEFYGSPPTWSYFNACSGGGRHALTSAQRIPRRLSRHRCRGGVMGSGAARCRSNRNQPDGQSVDGIPNSGKQIFDDPRCRSASL